ncbi:hypothetical protein DFH28DRAFT_892657, partial [Melampsora americana]
KAPVRWEDNKNEKGESALSLPLNWITTYSNWARYKNRNIVKKNTIEHVIQYLAENGIAPWKVNAVLDKVSLFYMNLYLTGSLDANIQLLLVD